VSGRFLDTAFGMMHRTRETPPGYLFVDEAFTVGSGGLYGAGATRGWRAWCFRVGMTWYACVEVASDGTSLRAVEVVTAGATGRGACAAAKQRVQRLSASVPGASIRATNLRLAACRPAFRSGAATPTAE